MVGGLTSFGLLTWMLVGASHYEGKGIIGDIPKALSTEGCPFPVNATLIRTRPIIR